MGWSAEEVLEVVGSVFEVVPLLEEVLQGHSKEVQDHLLFHMFRLIWC